MKIFRWKIDIFLISAQNIDCRYLLEPPDIFLISAQNIDCRYLLEPPQWGGSIKYPQSMFLSRNKKNNVYPVNLSFTI